MPPRPPASSPPEVFSPGDQRQTRITLRDIAKHLGVSHVAVSLALRERPGVSAELRERVRSAAAKLGYRPDPVLAALNNYRHGRESRPIRAALAWITLWKDPARMHSYREFEDYWQGASQVAEKHGYHLYEFTPDAKSSLAAVQRVMLARNIEGIMLSPPDRHFVLNPPALDWNKFSVVRFGYALESLRFHLVTSAQVSNTLMSIHRMRERGYRRIGFVTNFRNQNFTHFLDGFLRANEDIPSRDRIPVLNLPEVKPEEDQALLSEWIKTNRPDAVFSNLGSIRATLGKIRYPAPKKLGLAVTSVQDCDADSGIDQSALEIGRTACETLISLLMHGHRGLPTHQREILVEGRWMDGSTLPVRKQADSVKSKRSARALR